MNKHAQVVRDIPILTFSAYKMFSIVILSKKSVVVQIKDDSQAKSQGESGQRGVEINDGKQHQDSGDDITPIEDVPLASVSEVVVVLHCSNATCAGIQHDIRPIRASSLD